MRNNKVKLIGSEREPLGTRLGDQPGDEMIEVSVIVKPKTRAAIPSARGVHVSRQEFAAMYGADNADVDKIKQLAEQYGLKVTEVSLDRRTVKLGGTAANMMRAFDVRLDRYENEGQPYRARTGAVKLPADLVDSVEAVLGLDNRPQAKPHFRLHSGGGGEGVSYSPPQVAQLYQFPTDVDGTGQTVGIIELGGGYTPSSLATYFSGLQINPPTVVSVSVDNATNSPTNAGSEDGEVQLDIEVVGAIAPGATIVVYFAPSTAQGFLDALTTAIHDASNSPSVISISWGGAESTWTAQAMTAFDSAAQDAAALGVTICAASGDDGSNDGVNDGANHVDFPASSPHILGCGGTSVQSAGGTIASETVWNNSAGASGGGYSNQFPLPSWQSSINPPSGAGRGVPDVSGNADPFTGFDVSVDGTSMVIGGTSAVAPLWSGLIALVNQKQGRHLGFLHPTLYGLPAGTKALRDVVTGSNGAFSAASSWDACTGLGSPCGKELQASLSGDNVSAWLSVLLS